MYQPDAIASYRVGAHTFLVTANEGDAREYDGFGEAVRIGTVSLDPKRFPNGAALKNSANLGRLNITNTKCGHRHHGCLIDGGGLRVHDEQPLGLRVMRDDLRTAFVVDPAGVCAKKREADAFLTSDCVACDRQRECECKKDACEGKIFHSEFHLACCWRARLPKR